MSLAEKVPRVQRWHDFLSAYKFEIKYKPGRVNSNADMLSRLPQPLDDEEQFGDARITDPDVVDVYFVGAAGVWPDNFENPTRTRVEPIVNTHSLNLNGLGPYSGFKRGK